MMASFEFVEKVFNDSLGACHQNIHTRTMQVQAALATESRTGDGRWLQIICNEVKRSRPFGPTWHSVCEEALCVKP